MQRYFFEKEKIFANRMIANNFARPLCSYKGICPIELVL